MNYYFSTSLKHLSFSEAVSKVTEELKKEGFKIALVKNKLGKIFIMAVEREKIKIFKKYLTNQQEKVFYFLYTLE